MIACQPHGVLDIGSRCSWGVHMRDLSWSKREKQIAHAAFEQALAREVAVLVAEVRAKADIVTELDDLWELEQFLRDKRHALAQRCKLPRA
jgi:Photoprotection regulator fluorescence recovery protein